MRPNHSNGFDMSEVNRSKVALLPDDIIEKYKEAISHYAKVGFLFLVLIFATITDQTSCSSVNCFQFFWVTFAFISFWDFWSPVHICV